MGMEQMEKLISVIVPVYKVEKYIHKAVNSILEQTYRNLEVILVDDGSPDNCPKICDEYAAKDKRVKVIHQKNMGLAAARTSGIIKAKGEYVSFIDSDDWIESDMLEKMTLAAEKNCADIVICDYKTFNGDEEKTCEIHRQKLNNEWTVEKFRDEFLFDNYANFMCNKLYSKKLLNNIFIPNIIFEDLYVGAELFAKANKIYYVKECYYCYRVHASFTNMTQKTRRKYGLFMAWREHERVCEKYKCPPLMHSRMRAHKAAISLLVINEATGYLSEEERNDVESYLQMQSKQIVNLSLKHRMQWWTLKNMRPLCKVLGNISLYFDNLKQKKYKK